MAQVTGIAYVHVNGQRLRTKEGAKLNLGGKERTAQVGHAVYGYSEKVVPSQLDATLAHTSDQSLRDLSDLVGATITFQTDTGVVFTVANAFTTEPVEISDGEGDATLMMQGEPAIEQGTA